MRAGWKQGKMGWTAAAAAAAALMMASGVYAGEGGTSSSPWITVVKEAAFYPQAVEGTPTGILGAPQTLQVQESLVNSTGTWYKVNTWLGAQWIPQSAGAVMEGEIEAVRFQAHTLQEERLYAAPSHNAQLWETAITPQEVQVTARFHDWLQIETAAGVPRWLSSPLLLEEIREKPENFDMLLIHKEPLYETPYLKKTPMVLAPQTVHVLGSWHTGKGTYRFGEIVWYKIQTDEGPRWIQPKDEKQGILPVKEPVTLLTGGYGLPAPESESGWVWLEPGTKLEASARWQKWYQVDAGTSGTLWVNPEWSLMRRPPGTVESSVILQLTAESVVYRYPSPVPDDPVHEAGYYAPQEVRSIAKWSGDDQLDWYLFQGMDGDLWLPQPKSEADRSLVGSWSFRQDPIPAAGQGGSLALSLGKYRGHGFERGTGVPLTLRVESLGDQALSLTRPVELELQIVRLNGVPEAALQDPGQQAVVWTRRLPQLSGVFLPGTRATLGLEWVQQDAQGQPAAPGEYAARIVPAPITYETEGGAARTLSLEEVQAALGAPEVFAILP